MKNACVPKSFKYFSFLPDIWPVKSPNKKMWSDSIKDSDWAPNA